MEWVRELVLVRGDLLEAVHNVHLLECLFAAVNKATPEVVKTLVVKTLVVKTLVVKTCICSSVSSPLSIRPRLR